MLTDADMRSVLDLAYRTIAEVGILVRLPAGECEALPVRAADGRVVFAPEEVDGYLCRWRQRHGLSEPGWPAVDVAVLPSPGGRGAGGEEASLSLSVMPYAHTYLDPRTDEFVPLTADRAFEATRFLGTFAPDDVQATSTGAPVDVSPALQPILQYKLGAQYNLAGGSSGWVGDARTAEFVYRMAEAMGQPITRGVVYVVSPLKLGGVELDGIIAHRHRLTGVGVGSMGSCGATLPLDARAALALAWAETIAGAMCMEALTGLPADWHAGIDPFDLHAMTIPFGAPEQALDYQFGRATMAWMRGEPRLGGHQPLLTMAKRPGAQAMLEKSASAAFAVADGCTSLGAGGSLSCDEVFSPVQLILDRELRDWLQRLGQGVICLPGDDAARFAAIRDGISRGSFLQADETLDHYREQCWFPRHLRREMLATWQQLGSPDAVATARDEAIARIESASRRLGEQEFGELERIWREAVRELG